MVYTGNRPPPLPRPQLAIITCARDRDCLGLLLNSLDRYLATDCDLWLVINDLHQTVDYRPVIGERPLKILDRSDFDLEWYRIPRFREPLRSWSNLELNRRRTEGWVDQQLIKIALAEKMAEVKDYVVIDSKDFLIRPWYYPESSPSRTGKRSPFSERYCHEFGIPLENPPAAQTPFFFDRRTVLALLEHYGGSRLWSRQFTAKGHMDVSEFTFYWAWAKKHNRWRHPLEESWTRAFLRDVQGYSQFLSDLDMYVEFQPWASIHPKVWLDLDQRSYQELMSRLKDLGLDGDFSYLRSRFIQEEIPKRG